MSAPQTIDIESAVTAWARDDFYELAKAMKSKMKLYKKDEKHYKETKDHFIEARIDWRKTNFKDDQKPWARYDGKSNLVTDGANDETGNSKGSVSVDALASQSITGKGRNQSRMPEGGRPASNCLFETKFVNNSDKDQEYNLRTERTTTSTCETMVETGYTKGYEFGISLKTPCEVLEASASYSHEVSLTECKGEVLEKSMTWSVDCKVNVSQEKVAEAFLVVDEQAYSGKFEVVTYIWGDVMIRFHDSRKIDSPLIHTTQSNIATIMKEFLEKERRGNPTKYSFVSVCPAKSQSNQNGGGAGDAQEEPSNKCVPDVKHVRIVTKGKCDFCVGVKQEVLLNQISLDEYKERKKLEA